MERVAGYIRVSTEEQRLHGYSLDAQKMKISEYAEKHDLSIVGWYMDEGVSGRKLIKNRPALQDMMKDAKAGKFDRILFIKLDRFFRSVAEYHECMKQISPVTWTATEEEYDLTTANGRMLVNMKLTIAELEADQTGERIRITNEYKLKNGQPISGSVPFCFKIEKTPDGKRIVKNPETEHIMTDLLNYFLIHQNIRSTMFYIQNKYGILLSHGAIKRTLTNPLICGEYHGNPDFCEAYIDKATYNRLCQILPRSIKNNSTRNYYFSGLLRCPVCGRKMGAVHTKGRGQGGKHHRYYRCMRRANFKDCSQKISINEADLEALLLERIEPLFDRAQKIYATNTKKDNVIQLSKIRGELDRLNYSWQKGRIDEKYYDAEYAALNERIRLLEHADDAPNFERINSILSAGWREIYHSLSDDSKRAFWRSFIMEIKVEWNEDSKKIIDVVFL